MPDKKITVVGAGYVGLSLAVILSQKNRVSVLDINRRRVDLINSGRSTVEDNKIEKFFRSKELSISATSEKEDAYKDADFVIIATPTNYDELKATFDTSMVDKCVEDSLEYAPNAQIVIKSTVYVGYTDQLRNKLKKNNITFSPEFLREGSALEDNLKPSRLIIGDKNKGAKDFIALISEVTDEIPEIYFVSNKEAEAIKLFSNTFLAMRVAFFNELDSFSIDKGLNTKSIIDGVSSDPRIGDYYNNPSFGYGGYCLPKDTKQLLSNFKDVPQTLIKAIVESNSLRKDFISDLILAKEPSSVGFYRIIMKEGSDNIRSSAIQGVMKRLNAKGVKIFIFEPLIEESNFFGSQVISDFQSFINKSEIIIANRFSEELEEYKDKLFTRDIFGVN